MIQPIRKVERLVVSYPTHQDPSAPTCWGAPSGERWEPETVVATPGGLCIVWVRFAPDPDPFEKM